MEGKSQFLHVGITVADIPATIAFYRTYFGFELEAEGVFPAEFIGAKPMLYRQPEGVYSKFAFLRSPDGLVLELFQFSNMLPAQQPVWNRPGYHHICLKVDSCQAVYEQMCADGLQDCYYFPPDNMDPEGAHHWVFLTDPDGNMIELQD